jgi:hypothetical protein
MNAIEWMAARTRTLSTEVITVSADEADHAAEVGTYEVTTLIFTGRIPARMVREAQKLARGLTNDATTQHRVMCNPKTGVVEYFRSDYRKVA